MLEAFQQLALKFLGGFVVNIRIETECRGEYKMDNLSELIPLLIPLVVLQIGLIVIALRDLIKREKTKGPKWAWALVIVLVNTIGPIIYLLIGREE